MKSKRIQTGFNKQAGYYDDLILRLAPKYQEQNQLISRLIPFARNRKISGLDLGCGTGVLAYWILKTHPQARVTALDLAEDMLKKCEENLSEFKERLVIKKGDYRSDNFGSGYDVIVSGLSVHHLDDEEKKALYQRIYQALNPGGIFVNRDIVLGETPALTEEYHQAWRDFMFSKGEDGEFWFNKYLEMDFPTSVADQMTWLKEAGFRNVECYWRYINFAIFGGRKEGG